MSVVGETLYNERIKQGLTVSDISKKTNIRTYYIVAIEEGKFDSLPGSVYTKGFITNYAKVLGLDAKLLISEYKNEISSESNDNLDRENLDEKSLTTKEIIRLRREKESDSTKPLIFKIAIIVFALIILIAVFFIYFNGNDKDETVNLKASNYSNQLDSKTNKMNIESNGVIQNTTESSLKSKELDSINIKIEAKDKCWTEVEVDGKNIFYGMLTKGQKEIWSGKKIIIKLGNINAIAMEVNNKKYLPTQEEINKAVVIKEFNSSLK